MASLQTLIEQMKAHPGSVRFSALSKVCKAYFGEPRRAGSHHTYKTPWPGDPRINIQNDNGKAKAYQVRQVLAAIDKLGGQYE